MATLAGIPPIDFDTDEDFFDGDDQSVKVKVWWGIYAQLSRVDFLRDHVNKEFKDVVDELISRAKNVYSHFAAGFELGIFAPKASADDDPQLILSSNANLLSCIREYFDEKAPRRPRLQEPWALRMERGFVVCKLLMSGTSWETMQLYANENHCTLTNAINHLLAQGLFLEKKHAGGHKMLIRRTNPWTELS